METRFAATGPRGHAANPHREHPAVSTVTMVCKECGSDNISCDAIVFWRKGEQRWFVSDVSEDCFCYECNERREFDAEPWTTDRE